MLSFICASNNRNIFDECLGPSLERQRNRDFELILVDTIEQKYASAAEALNYGASQASGEYLVFLHQDICIEDSDFIDHLLGFLSQSDFYIAGIAGAIAGKRSWRTATYTNIVHGADRHPAGRRLPGDKIFFAETLDECLFIIPRDVFAQRQLADFAPTWHLYAVEYSLWANTKSSNSVVVFPLKLWHRSAAASFNADYYDALHVLIRIYRRYTRMIHTPMGAWPTNPRMLDIKKAFRQVKPLRKIRAWVRRRMA